jgi:ABC-type sulfate transport system permease component
MPRYNQDRMKPIPAWFEKLPRKLQVFLLLLLMLAAAAVPLMMGLHSLHTGKPIVLGNESISAVESFFWCAACLAIAAGLFAVLMGWAKSSTDPSK